MREMSRVFDLDALRDDYVLALKEVVDAKLAGTPLPEHVMPSGRPGPVVDLMEALRSSVEAAKADAPKPPAGGGRKTKKAPARKGS